jgi:hypothetical protein
MKLKDGIIYDGEWLNGKMHGIGVLTLANGSKYDGSFENSI